MPEFPAMLYKPGSMLLWDGEMFDYLVVLDEAEYASACADGWSVGKPGAVETPPMAAPVRGRRRKAAPDGL